MQNNNFLMCNMGPWFHPRGQDVIGQNVSLHAFLIIIPFYLMHSLFLSQLQYGSLVSTKAPGCVQAKCFLACCFTLHSLKFFNGPHSAVGNVSGNRYESDCRTRGHEFDNSLVPRFRGD